MWHRVIASTPRSHTNVVSFGPPCGKISMGLCCSKCTITVFNTTMIRSKKLEGANASGATRGRWKGTRRLRRVHSCSRWTCIGYTSVARQLDSWFSSVYTISLSRFAQWPGVLVSDCVLLQVLLQLWKYKGNHHPSNHLDTNYLS